MSVFLYHFTIFKILVVIKVWSKFLEGYVKIKHWFLFPKAKLCFKQWLLPLFVKLLFPCCDRQLSTEVMDGENCAQNYQRTNRQHRQLLEVKPEVYRDRDRKWQALTNSILACKPQKKGKRVLLGWKRSSKNKNQSGCCILTTILKKNNTEVQLTRMHERKET